MFLENFLQKGIEFSAKNQYPSDLPQRRKLVKRVKDTNESQTVINTRKNKITFWKKS